MQRKRSNSNVVKKMQLQINAFGNSQTVEEPRLGEERPLSPGKISHPWRLSVQRAPMDSRVSILSEPSSVYRAPSHGESLDDLELLDANGCIQDDAGNKAKDPNIVEWDGPDDPENPLNWSALRKWANVIIFSTITMIR